MRLGLHLFEERLQGEGDYAAELVGVHLGGLGVALHRVGFSRTCLPICEYGAVVALHGLVHQVVDSAAVIHSLLGIVLEEDVVELERFGGTVQIKAHLVPILIGVEKGIAVSVSDFGL